MRLQHDAGHAGLLAGACHVEPIAPAVEEAGCAVVVQVDRALEPVHTAALLLLVSDRRKKSMISPISC